CPLFPPLRLKAQVGSGHGCACSRRHFGRSKSNARHQEAHVLTCAATAVAIRPADCYVRLKSLRQYRRILPAGGLILLTRLVRLYPQSSYLMRGSSTASAERWLNRRAPPGGGPRSTKRTLAGLRCYCLTAGVVSGPVLGPLPSM